MTIQTQVITSNKNVIYESRTTHFVKKQSTEMTNIAQGILTREEGRNYLDRLSPDSKIFQEINRNMSMSPSGSYNPSPLGEGKI